MAGWWGWPAALCGASLRLWGGVATQPATEYDLSQDSSGMLFALTDSQQCLIKLASTVNRDVGSAVDWDES